MTNEIAIKVEDLSKCYHIYEQPRHRLLQMIFRGKRRFYREFWALKEISFDVKKGETIGIIGRNGCGKSTLLQMICGTLNPTHGNITSHGRIAALLELGSGFNPEFSGAENIVLYGAILGLTRNQMVERYNRIIEFADIGEFIDHPIKTYSSGMVVRLAFATAIHVSPSILVVDEALAVGDTAFQQKCLMRIRDMQREGVSIILVTHSNNTLIEFCDRGIYIKNGAMVLDGPCRDVVKAYGDDLVLNEGGHTLPSSQLDQNVPQSSNKLRIKTNEGTTDKSATRIIPIEIVSTTILDKVGKLSAGFCFGDEVWVKSNIRIYQEVLEPCFGIQLASVDGIVLWSATTQSMGISVSRLAKGDHCVRWRLIANFSGNRYIVSIGVGQVVSGEYKRSHRLDYAGFFDVLPVPHSGSGWLEPTPGFFIDEKDSLIFAFNIE